MNMKKLFNSVNFQYVFAVFIAILSFIVPGASGIAMAEAIVSPLPDAGKTIADVASITAISQADPDFFLNDIDRRVTRIRPMSTPLDQISRYAKNSQASAMEFEYGSVGTRPVMTTLNTEVTAQGSGMSISIDVVDATMFDIDDTIRVVGVKGYDKDGKETTQDLVLSVCGKNAETNMPTVYAVNGKSNGKQQIWVPAIPAGTKLVRMGKACSELDAKTGLFTNVPEMKEQYCQKFMAQITESTYKKIVEERQAGQKVDWNFSDLEEDAIYDMRLGQENSFLFGVKNKVLHTSKGNSQQWFTEGIWWQCGQDLTVGSRNDAGEAVITDDDLVDLAKDLFCGTGVGNKRKVVFCGSEFQATLAKIKSEKHILREKDSVDVWKLKFKSVDTDFGELLTIHHELFDLNGMADCAMAIDPSYLSKKTFEAFTRVNRDDMENGTSDSMTVMLKESCALYLRYPKAHARMKLA